MVGLWARDPAASWSSRPAAAARALLPVFGIDPHERTLSLRHAVAAPDRLLGGRFHFGGDLAFDRGELRRGPTLCLEILLVQPDRVPPPPLLEQSLRQSLARLPLVVGGVAPHPKRPGHQQ